MSLTTIYFVQEGHDGPIKIGATKQNLYYRIAHMQCGNYRRLQVLGIIKGQPRDVEDMWHRRFADVRLHGEWFSPVASLMQAILEESEAPDPKSIPSPSSAKMSSRDDVGRDGWVSPRARNALKHSDEAA